MRELIERYRLRELVGIGSAGLMAIISYVPVYSSHDLRQLAVALSFLAVFALRLALFVWNRRVEGREDEGRSRAKMMVVAAVVLLFLHVTILVSVLYQLLYAEGTPLMASSIHLALAYGVYAVARMVLSARGMARRRKENLYAETLGYISWIMAFYTLALFTNYLLILEDADTLVWPRYIMISCMGLLTLVLAAIMLSKGIRALGTLGRKADAREASPARSGE
ncbi:MAG: hypothetical protein Q4B54_14430 [Coriobacteriales bacterium]|nr:hypothetical protein [Coriobacteriales bacterium]